MTLTSQTDVADALGVCLVQTAPHWHDPQANRQLFDHWFDRVPDAAEIVVLPEMFSTGFTMASKEQAEPIDGPTTRWLVAAAHKLGKTLCGSVVIARDDSGERFANRLLWVTPQGEVTHYDKRHRFRMAGEHQHYDAGEERVVVVRRGVRILLQVCYDLRFPVFARNRGDYDVYLLVANWPAVRQQHWQTLLAARAIENQCYVVAVNRTGTDGNDVHYRGGSTIYGYDGEVNERLVDREGLVSGHLDMAAQRAYREEFPAWQDADAFTIDC